MKRDIVIIGGGLAGLVSALLLSRKGIRVTLVEKKTYPFHKVCGEYVSNEVIPFLKSLNAFPEKFSPPRIKRFQLTSLTGKSFTTGLDLGGFGISRYTFDNFFYELAENAGTEFILQTGVDELSFENNSFRIRLSNGNIIDTFLVIGAYGKKSRIDNILDRDFTHHPSPFLGVKYHIEYDFPDDLVALHNFKGGYCGIVRIEDGKYNLCYLASRNLLKKSGTIEKMEGEVLCNNPHLADIFSNARFLFEKPLVINEFSFESKKPVVNHVLMTGDSAGLITPLCGNGMAMAIHSGKIAAGSVIDHFNNGNPDRTAIEREYESCWNITFKRRLWIGRQVQKLFGGKNSSEMAVQLLKRSPALAQWIIKNTHGEPF
jgi:menaquinone-9 beta-reductase